ncbi:Suppressor of activated egl-4 protein 1 [Caenorhabditis elegans]|uniref:Suppressor of activated egl-4 protein 1 n=4 Tax=Caenorhabditis elegans TaxID=6239 RepID=SAEG1_CAEEL|nr:Suppressor of activated egl-4 protein 1 [Caenorhabditis elegans]Q20733.2 RecName: Full=Suppressor of activated egl-4 protein 1 [Caenorhabditis elegans]CAB01216.2 Suppressor of activated egl-4 protein 1 [Caenorhabditis elegans]|eukprot:NP_505769.2 Suppressor of activated egl-4 protein 1 [Caenorhabditis elegans]
MPPPQHPPNYYAPRRSISTITGPNRRDVDAFYQNNFPEKNGGSSGEHVPEYQASGQQHRPSIMSGQSHQNNHLPTKNYSYEPLRFSPPNVTPPPLQFSTNTDGNRKNQRVRFNELPNYSTPNHYSVPPRKCSLAPNFFSSQNSHHMYPDQYTPRTWQNNEFMPNHQVHPYHANHQQQHPQQHWRNQAASNGNHNPMYMRKHSAGHGIEIKLDHVDNPFGNPSHDMMDVTSGQPVKSEMLSPIKMETTDPSQQIASPSFLMTSTSLLKQHLHKKSHHNVPSRKASIMALKSQLRTPRGTPLNISTVPGTELPYTPPPILAPMRNGSGLFCQIVKSANSSLPVAEQSPDAPSCSTNGVDGDMKHLMNGKKRSEDGDGPSRKNGFFYMAQQMNQTNFANELEALRKESWASTSSADEKMQTERKESLESIRKASCMSDSYYEIEEGPKISDPNPHINLGKNYQARVKKWCDRQVSTSERDAIEDRDEIVFSSEILQDIDPEQITAFELLACSQACPRAGRNKELALHLLMENKGNIEAAVEDLLRSDTLDWEHYSSVFGYMYNDSVLWTPDEIYQFQDAIYQSEKDFDKVAVELPGKSVKECVQFYYTWKKDCPDDYRKLRNLRRKRQLLDINLQKNQSEEPVVPAKKISIIESGDSDNESNATDSSFIGNGHMEFRDRAFTSPMMSSPREEPIIGLSPSSKDLFGIQKNYQPTAPRAHHTPSASASKKGAQPSADGFFHCRLCDKCFEKVKSLNAHMKSHAMKARAEQEAKAHDAQVAAAAAAQLTSAVGNVVGNPVATSPLNSFANGHLGISIPSTIGNLTPQQLTPQQLNLNQQLQTQLNSLSNQMSLNSPLTPQQQLQQFTQQHLMARAMQQNLFQPVTSTPLVQPTHPLIQAGLHSIN